MTTAVKTKKTAATKVAKAAAAQQSPLEYQPIKPYRATNQDCEVVTVFEQRNDGAMVGWRRKDGTESRSPIANITPAPEPHPTEFTEHEPIAATYRKGNTEHQVTITATRNDGKLYRIEGPTIKTVALPIEKVMIYQPEPITIDSPAVSDNLVDDPALAEILKAPAVEPAVEPAEAPVPEGWAIWSREPAPIDRLKGSGESTAQITNRYSNEAERDYVNQMLMGLWEYDRPGSEPRLFWDGDEYHTGDGHHTIQCLQIASDWLNDAKLNGLNRLASSEEVIARFEAGLIELPDTIPCLVKDGTAADAKAYSLREANRFNGMRLTNEQKRCAIADLVSDADQLDRVVAWICERTGKDYAKLSGSIPADRAIAEYLGNVSAPTVGDVTGERFGACDRLGLDGKVLKAKKTPKPKPQKATEPDPQLQKFTGDSEADDSIADDTDQGATAMGGAAGETAATSTPAPTDSAPVAPGQTYTGKARFKRIEELSTSTAERLIQQIAGEMKTKTPASEVLESLIVAIRQELEFYVTGDQF